MQPVKGPQQGFPQQGPPPGFQGHPQQGPPQGFTPQGYPPQQPQQHVVLVQQPVLQHAKHLSGFDRINKDGLFIKQKVDIVEIASGCERENSYSIFNLDKANEKTGVELLRAREKSNFCARQLLSGGCRPFVLNIQLRDNDPKVHNQAFLELERPCTCTFMCWARPVINVHHVEGGQRTYLGKLVNPCQCNCNLNLEVYDNRNLLLYKIKGACCQSGVVCGQYDCQSCQTVDLTISTPTGNDVSSIQKKSAGFCASKVSLADNWAVMFPNNITVETKALLLSATIFLDYLFFEKGGIGTMK